jgi:hypothetical protein
VVVYGLGYVVPAELLAYKRSVDADRDRGVLIDPRRGREKFGD